MFPPFNTSIPSGDGCGYPLAVAVILGDGLTCIKELLDMISLRVAV